MNYDININVRILIIGDLMLDHYIYGSCTRISPEAPVQVVEIKNEDYTLGGAGNVLKNLIAFNCPANIISLVGTDDSAQIVKTQLAQAGVTDYKLIEDPHRCTTVKSRVLVSNHQLIRLDREDISHIDGAIVKQFKEIISREINKYDIVLLSDYNKGLLSSPLLKYIIDSCRKASIKTVVDPKGTDFTKYAGVNVIKPNKKEAIIASGIVIKDQASLEAACKKIQEQTGCDDVIITMSEDGIAMYSESKLQVIPTRALDVVDVTGAGDTVLASLGLALASGNTLYNACDFANHAAAVVVSKVGSATATLEEVKQKFVN